MTPTSSDVARQYANLQVQTASNSKRICMLHVRCTELVVMAQSQESAGKRRLLLDKAQNILSQLQTALRVEDSVSEGLFFLYDYCYVLLERGNDADMSNALNIVGVLRTTFDQLLRTL